MPEMLNNAKPILINKIVDPFFYNGLVGWCYKKFSINVNQQNYGGASPIHLKQLLFLICQFVFE